MKNNKETIIDSKNVQKTKKVVSIISIVLGIILAFTAGYFSRYILEPKSANITSEIVKIIQNNGYVMDKEGNLIELTEEDYADLIVEEFLDKYSHYYTKEEYEKIKNERGGDTSGYGVQIVEDITAPAYLYRVVPNSPADLVGLRSGDLVVSATKNGTTYNIDNGYQLGEFLNGEVGVQVSLNVARNGKTIETPFAMTKSNYRKSYVEYYDAETKIAFRTPDNKKYVMTKIEQEKMPDLDEKTSLIRLTQFEGEVASQFQNTLDYMKANGKTKLILDLRDNGGGYMDVLEEVCACLIINGGKKTLVAQAQGKNGNQNFYITKTKNNSFLENIVVLANQNTASASECLIGAMLHYGEKFSASNLIIEKNDYGVATTYGKGIMQTTYPLSNGGALKLTTAKIFLPDEKTSIHGLGFTAYEQNQVESGNAVIIRAVEILKG